MVGTRPKNKLGRIPHGTKIDLSPPKKKSSARKKIAMEDVAFPAKFVDKKKESPPGVDVDLLLGLSAGEGATLMLAEAEHTEKGADKTPTGAKDAETPEKEKTSTPSKGNQTSSSLLRKVKAESSAAASSPAETEVEGSEEEASEGEASEEVNSSEAGEDGDEKKVEEDEGTDDDEPPAKRAKTPSQAKEKETVTVAKKDLAGRKIIAPKRLDFDVLEELGVANEVREKFANIGWKKFLDLDTTAYTELVREFFKKLKVVVNGAEGPAYIEFTLMGKRERLTPNQINSELGVTNILKMLNNEFAKVVLP